ncbi:hypothetical protein SPRG_21476 [Saprolegnia parasitica CBS 223.65]|uniref:Acyltransferase 3 domain-containing protein n=1 Tax=Saprolegnia parasitica (strain CBS 223.65) TaxID=695850 RepID=A0A067BQT6_SAPPC|nr:hypothetical protein SPRG_21476 [Saprolegnia parasitica CBS 223.65]KDO19135.1 hypothetical protein SPRG_21476 [Saprolegnia parasitica CBS 223.65]|eukprot:XP_012210168.1 hypothetical protein SPRG_21476 [Saprolegnia parasitica CBS 223.65]
MASTHLDATPPSRTQHEFSALTDGSHDSFPVLIHDDDGPNEEEVLHEVAPPAHSLSYRADIDGLRTVAVVPVVIFHAYPTAFAGGFIGVDIFFVISGFLISGILFKQFKASKFTYSDFYARRIRRIFPGLLLMLIATVSIGCAWYLAPALKSMAATLTAGCVFGANIQVLTLKMGYFDASIKENPLLHLWSLGVEEQFYIFWPLFASLVIKLSYRKAILAQVFVLVASFVCNVAFLGYGGTNNYAFYFPLSRFWQMAVGGLLSYINLQNKVMVAHHGLCHVLALLGLAALVVGFFIINEEDAFPGFWALLPTAGAGLLIASGPHTFVHKYFLSLYPMVWIGQLSYAWYLWHWPLLVFAKAHWPQTELRPWYAMPYSMVLLSLLLSVFTLYGVENHLRRRKAAWLVPLLSALMVVMAMLGICIQLYPTAFSALETAPHRFPSAVFYTANGMPPLSCNADHAKAVDAIKTVKPKSVLYASDWKQFLRFGSSSASASASPRCCTRSYADACDYQSKGDVEAMIKTLTDELTSFTKLGIQVYVAGLNPEGKEFNPKNMLSGSGVGKVDPVSRAAYEAMPQIAYLNRLLVAATKAANATLINFADNQCYRDTCQVLSNVGEPIMRDDDHFRPAYVKHYLSVIDQVIDAARY